ncbi:HAMP domain-containing sensor histidine kinase [Nonomuraea africana]|uniref:HAMP domain-containing sensor histidine kinase n=1 Tax=Nonomuraea africana TaxID=46171 RepID=UPI00340998B6
MRRRSLRSRLTLLVTVAVAVAIAASAGLCWFIVSRELYHQLDQSMAEPESPENKRWLVENCKAEGTSDPFQGIATVLYADGTTCSLGPPIKASPQDRHALDHPGRPEFRFGSTTDGKALRVMTTFERPGMAILEARPIYQAQNTLRNLALVLAVVAAIGVLGAASAGLLVSRTALRPVGRLTRAVEHIAQTEDLNTTIPVEGTDEIARLSRSFNAMTAALAGSRDRQQQLVADAGHELRTPLTSLRTNIDLLLRSEHTGRAIDPKAKERLLVNVKAQFEELSTLVGDLLQLSRGESDHEPHVELAFHDVVNAAVARARLRGADVTTDLDPWYVEGTPTSLERAVVNLLDNAAKFSPGGKVEVALRGGELTVRDHGPGIHAEELPHVFERFWRSPSARSLPGSGLGLAIVAQAIQEAGGEVRLDNAAGGGAVAWVRLPGSSGDSRSSSSA